MNQEELATEIEKQTSQAYVILFDTIGDVKETASIHKSSISHVRKSFLDQDWEQLLFGLLNIKTKSTFGETFGILLESAQESHKKFQELGFRNAMEGMSSEELVTIKECILAGSKGPFFSDGDYPIIIGLERSEADKLIKNWPLIAGDTLERCSMLINNTLNWLLYYPTRAKDKWNEFLSIPPVEVKRLYQKFRDLSGRINNSKAMKAEAFKNMEL